MLVANPERVMALAMYALAGLLAGNNGIRPPSADCLVSWSSYA